MLAGLIELPHRGIVSDSLEDANMESVGYRFAVGEIICGMAWTSEWQRRRAT